MPLSYRLGSRFSSYYVKAATRRRISDAHSGLRAIPSSLFQSALDATGNRYEYEMAFLLDAAHSVSITEVAIETMLPSKDYPSHYRPIRDSFRIYRAPFLYGIASVLSWVIDLLLFYLLSEFVFTSSSEAQVFASAMIARVCSGAFNFLTLNLAAFQTKGGLGKKALKYSLLWAINLGISSGLTYAFKFIPLGLTFVKFIIDTVIAIANYFINLGWVFVNKRKKAK